MHNVTAILLELSFLTGLFKMANTDCVSSRLNYIFFITPKGSKKSRQ